MSFYGDMAELARELLTEFDQGGIILKKYSDDDTNSEPWKPKDVAYNDIPTVGTVSGITEQHLADSLIKASDLVVTIPGNLTPTLKDKIEIEKNEYAIIRLKPLPAAGVRSAWEVVIRK